MSDNPFQLLGESLKAVRKASKLTQSELAAKIGCKKNLIIRMEAGGNVGVHAVIKAIEFLGYKMEISLKDLQNATIVLGDFDSFYQEQFRKALDTDLKQNPNGEHGFISVDKKRNIRVVNWKKAVKI